MALEGEELILERPSGRRFPQTFLISRVPCTRAGTLRAFPNQHMRISLACGTESTMQDSLRCP